MAVLLVFADNDSVSQKHIAEFFALLGGGVKEPGWLNTRLSKARLAVVPGCTAIHKRRKHPMTYTATYSPEDNKLRLYSSTRLDRELYARVRGAGFIYAPKQELFVAPMWTPEREDLLIELCGEIDDEDTSLVERAEERADRFVDYKDKRIGDAERAHEAVSRIADHIPLGQPILIGHHSER